MIKVEDMMTRHPYTLTPQNTFSDAKSLMQQHEIRHVPIIDEKQKLVGIISHRDLLRSEQSALEVSSIEASSNILSTHHLSELTDKKLMTVSPTASLKESAIYMQKNKIGCLPVVYEGHLVGIITDTDFVSIAINLLELQEEEEDEFYQLNS